MKCPKCHYLSFEPSPRCRNCGFDLGIADVDLPIRPAEEDVSDAPPADLELRPKRRAAAARRAPKTLGLIHPARPAQDVEAPREAAAAVALMEPEVIRPAVEPPRREPVAPPRAPLPPMPPPQTPGELPLFVKGLLSGQARAPLAVRRAAPELVRPKPAPTPPRKPGPFDRDLMEDLKRVEAAEEVARRRSEAAAAAAASSEAAAVGPVRRRTRLAALSADWAILSAMGAVILWACLRVAGARVTDLGLPALAPFSAFLLLIVFAYFLLFTAGNGQTPGKMALQIRVVDATVPDRTRPPSPRQALYRMLLAPDRFTHTRTVRA